jgi:NodT family efflux transporter outer membrane factor (OMF) lipoprotein
MSLHPAPRRSPLRASIALATLALLSACSSPAPQALAPGWSNTQLGLQAQAGTPIAADWWTTWGDARLQALVTQALQDHPNMQQAQARVRRMQALAGVADAASLPQVGLGADFSRQRYSANGLFPKPIAGNTWNNDTLQVSLGWSPDLWGEHAAALSAAVGQVRASEAEAAMARQMLAAQILRGSVGLARLLAQGEASTQLLQVREQAQTLVRQRHAAGLDTRIDQAQSETSLAELQTQHTALQEQIALARHQLAVLCALPPQALQDYAPRLDSFALAPLPAQLGADLLGRRADVVAARWRAEAAQDSVQVARVQFYPSVSLGAFAGYNALGTAHLLEAGSQQYGVVPALRLPLFEGGRLKAQLSGRQAERDTAVAQYNQAVLDAVREAADAIRSSEGAATQATEQARALAGSTQAHALAQQREQAGLGNRLVVLGAQTALIAQQRAAIDLQARQLDVRVQLVRALGGGWSAEATTTASR